MSNYNSQLQSNNEALSSNNLDLQSLIDQANALPDAGGVELPELTNEGSASDLLFGKQLIDQDGSKIIGSMHNNGTIALTMDGIDVKSVIIPEGYTSGGTVNLDDTIDNEVDIQADSLNQLISVLRDKMTANTICPTPLIDIDMYNNGINLGTGGSSYDSTVANGGFFSNGKFVTNGTGSLTVPTDFMSGANQWTIVVAIDGWEPSNTAAYGRFMRGSKDVPSLFYTLDANGNMFKLADTTMFQPMCQWLAPDTFTTKNNVLANALLIDIPKNERTVVAFRNDGSNITMWINGEAKIARKSSYYVNKYYADTFSIGDNANVGYSLARLECSMLKAWNIALTDSQMPNVLGGA